MNPDDTILQTLLKRMGRKFAEEMKVAGANAMPSTKLDRDFNYCVDKKWLKPIDNATLRLGAGVEEVGRRTNEGEAIVNKETRKAAAKRFQVCR